ncbi:hypothetical protein DRQ07_09415 [candidate division KSB1 bacterium]|nr:MAG: hypothetical protein DRQ07_09415 [candidate division KSB1 bacterium]
MPRGDRTGPAGMGPMTGRAAGFCAGYNQPGFTNPVGGRLGAGFGWGRGFGGRGMGFGFGRGRYFGGYGSAGYPYYGGAAGITKDQELDLLKNQAEALDAQLKNIRDRMSDLESKNTDQD